MLSNNDYYAAELVNILSRLIIELKTPLLEVPTLTEANLRHRLDRMIQLGHIESYQVESPKTKGAIRTYYRITHAGEDLLASIQDLYDRAGKYGESGKTP